MEREWILLWQQWRSSIPASLQPLCPVRGGERGLLSPGQPSSPWGLNWVVLAWPGLCNVPVLQSRVGSQGAAPPQLGSQSSSGRASQPWPSRDVCTTPGSKTGTPPSCASWDLSWDLSWVCMSSVWLSPRWTPLWGVGRGSRAGGLGQGVSAAGGWRPVGGGVCPRWGLRGGDAPQCDPECDLGVTPSMTPGSCRRTPKSSL